MELTSKMISTDQCCDVSILTMADGDDVCNVNLCLLRKSEKPVFTKFLQMSGSLLYMISLDAHNHSVRKAQLLLS